MIALLNGVNYNGIKEDSYLTTYASIVMMTGVNYVTR